MTITDYQALKRWFFNNSRGEKPAPYWTLYSLNIGDKKTMLTRNDRLSSMNEAWTFLEESLQAMSAKGGQFEVMQTDVPRGNNPVGTIWFEPARSNGALPAIAGMPGTTGSGAPTGYYSKEDVDQLLDDALEKWELKARIGALEEQLRTPAQAPTIFDQVKEFAATPVGTALLAKLAGVDLGALGALVNGTPNPGEQATDDEELEQMDAKLEQMAQTVGVSESDLVTKLYKFTQTQPEMARQLIASL